MACTLDRQLLFRSGLHADLQYGYNYADRVHAAEGQCWGCRQQFCAQHLLVHWSCGRTAMDRISW